MFVICESEAWKLEPLLQTLYDGYLNNLQLVTNQELKYQKTGSVWWLSNTPQIESINLRQFMNLPSMMLIHGLVVSWYKTSLLRWKCHTGSRFTKMLKKVFLYRRWIKSDWVYWKCMVSLWGNLQSCSRVSLDWKF